jgi:prepilin-type N-terminal cleavage/methylation domain-containing protein
MHSGKRRRATGFTLVELLTVVAIIALLIGILVPALSKVRDAGKRVSTQNLLAVLGKGCEMFQGDFQRYPRSSGGNPFESATDTDTPLAWPSVPLSGAQWLILELAGANFLGYVSPGDLRGYDTNSDGVINSADWLNYYDPTVDPNISARFRRWGPYIPIDGRTLQSPEANAAEGGRTLPPQLKAGTSVWSNGKLAMAVDAYRFPVLYYAANAQAKVPFSEWTGTSKPGCYDQRDNLAFTGSDVPTAVTDHYDLVGGDPNRPPFGTLGWASTASTTAPAPNTFAGRIYDPGVFGSGTTGKVWPRRPDGFLLVTPGPDGRYGTNDDITNY